MSHMTLEGGGVTCPPLNQKKNSYGWLRPIRTQPFHFPKEIMAPKMMETLLWGPLVPGHRHPLSGLHGWV